MRALLLHVSAANFHKLKSGESVEEYRNARTKFEEKFCDIDFKFANDYWTRQLTNAQYERVIVLWGYPRLDDKSKRIDYKWKGAKLKTVSDDKNPNLFKEVFAIDLSERLE